MDGAEGGVQSGELRRSNPGLRPRILFMPGLVPGIHVLSFRWAKTWMAGSSPAMTVDSGSLSLLAMPERDQLPQSADRDAAGKCAGLKLYMPAPPPAFRSKSSFIGGGNGAV